MGLRNEFLCVLSFVVTVTGVLGGDYCYDFDDSYPRWCAYGCCGSLDRECCDANVGLIVGMTVLAILIIATIIAVVCCCIRRRAAPGQVIQTNPGPGGLVVTSAQTTMMSSGQPVPYTTQGYQPGVYAPPQPYTPQPYAPQPYAPPPQGYPMGQQAAPSGQPVGNAMSPPPYSEVQGGQVNPGFDYKPFNQDGSTH